LFAGAPDCPEEDWSDDCPHAIGGTTSSIAARQAAIAAKHALIGRKAEAFDMFL
jgi:hypothetical protein